MRVAVVGKGGAGKSVIAGTMARVLGPRGHTVLALDSDLMPGLAESLGMGLGAEARLDDAAERGDDPGGLYRALRALERDGLVHSAWEPSASGPDRRIYELTRAGMEELHRRAKSLAETADTLDVFLSRYGEFVALERSADRAQERR